MFAQPISTPRFKSIIFFIKLALKLSYFEKKMQKGLCPQTPKAAHYFEFLPTGGVKLGEC